MCLLFGVIGLHFFYLGKYKEGFRRFGLFWIVNIYCIYKSIVEAYRLIRMSDYEFYIYSSVERVKGTESYVGLHTHINKITSQKRS